MNDTDLANAVVELGIINGDVDLLHDGGYVYWIGNDVHDVYSASEIVRDPRVAMALMEKMSRYDLIKSFVDSTTAPKWHLLDQLRDPRAITEAAVKALKVSE